MGSKKEEPRQKENEEPKTKAEGEKGQGGTTQKDTTKEELSKRNEEAGKALGDNTRQIPWNTDAAY